MGLLDSAMPQQQMQPPMQQAPQGGLLGAPSQGAQSMPPMPPEMLQVVAQLKQMEPQARQGAMQQIIQKIQSSGKSQGEVQQAVQQLMAAVGQ